MGRPLSVVYYHLAKLHRVGLTVKVKGVWFRAGAATLDQVAQVLNVAGIGAAQKERHRLDRKNYQEEREAWQVERRRAMMAGKTSGEKEVERVVQVPEEARDVLAVIGGVFELEVVSVVPVKVKRPQELLPGLGR
jgi:hypothetical protein